MEKKIEDEKKIKIMINALKYYLGMPLRLEEASIVFRLIKKVRNGDVKFTEPEKTILLKALNRHMKRFFRLDATIDVERLIQEAGGVPACNRLTNKWVLYN